MSGMILGIDLGTPNSAVGVVDSGFPLLLTNEDGCRITGIVDPQTTQNCACWKFELQLACSVVDDFQEPLKKRVGGSLSKLPPLQRLEMLRRNAWMIRQKPWAPPTDDGTVVRKTVGLAR
jgi:hypothetical protein